MQYTITLIKSLYKLSVSYHVLAHFELCSTKYT